MPSEPSTFESDAWAEPQREARLGPDDVHVWRVSLGGAEALVERYLSLLAPAERERATRFHFARDAARFAATRAALRGLLARYTGGEPLALRFAEGRYGKPSLEGAPGGEVRFNVSHSADLALCAFSRGREVGVDLERVRADLDAAAIAERYFSPREVATIRSLPPGLAVDGFFACWTRKEAFIKARGDGLSFPLDGFDVEADPRRPAALLECRACAEGEPTWTLASLSPGPGYKAAVAVEGAGWRLSRWALDPAWAGAGFDGATG